MRSLISEYGETVVHALCATIILSILLKLIGQPGTPFNYIYQMIDNFINSVVFLGG